MSHLQTWRAGSLAAEIDPATGFLQYLSFNGVELLRGIYVAVRDPDWGTVAPVIRDWLVADHRITFIAECREGPIDLVWQGTIEVVGDTLRYTMDGQARTTFRRNRIGFCILHPMDVAGAPCTVEHVDGISQSGLFPDLIAPHQPFLDLRAIRHEPAPGLTVEVRCDGATFEMEDQRNWTDASFKTYCTPLGLPFPVEVSEGTRVRQSVTVSLRRNAAARPTARTARSEATITADLSRVAALPQLGFGYHPDTDSDGLAAVRPAYLRVDLHLAEPGWRDALAAAAALGYPLELAIIDDLSVEPALPPIDVPLARVLLFDADRRATRPHNLDRWLPVLRSRGAPVAGGTDAWFAELNREPPPLDELDRVTFSITPQVHAFDDASVMETIAAQEVAARCAKQIAGGLPVGISTVTLLPRFNPNATSGAAAEPSIDPRQATTFCAAWTVGSLNVLARAGVDCVTYYETAGPRGVAGFPVARVFAAVAPATGVFEARSDQPLVAEALVLAREDGPVALVANLTATPRTVRLEPVGSDVELGSYEVVEVALG